MSQILFIINMSINSILFIKMNHPMNMGIMLLIQTLMTCMLTGLMSQTPWFSYILFLVFLGGMLVLFIYMTSIASNEMFQKSNYLVIIVGIIIMSTTLIIMLSDPAMTTIHNTSETMSMNNMFAPQEKMMLLNLYNMPNAMITLFMVMYLFLTLIVIVFITKFHQGPLRPNH